jgi:hypothetical protein
MRLEKKQQAPVATKPKWWMKALFEEISKSPLTNSSKGDII